METNIYVGLVGENFSITLLNGDDWKCFCLIFNWSTATYRVRVQPIVTKVNKSKLLTTLMMSAETKSVQWVQSIARAQETLHLCSSAAMLVCFHTHADFVSACASAIAVQTQSLSVKEGKHYVAIPTQTE